MLQDTTIMRIILLFYMNATECNRPCVEMDACGKSSIYL